MPSTAQLEEWLAERLAQRHEFLRRCLFWSADRGGVLEWPGDQAAILRLGVPCENCVTVVHRLGAAGGSHRLVVRMVPAPLHWSDGITAHCDGAPAYEAG